MTILWTGPTSDLTVKENLNFSIYPNPSIGVFRIELNSIETLIHLSINDDSGKTVVSEVYFNIDIIESTNTVLSSGLYIITFNDFDGNTIQRKLVVK